MFVNIHDVWFDMNKYYESKYLVKILHTNKVIDNYSLIIKEKTFIIDLSQNVDAIFSNMDKKSAQYSINKAIKSGVYVNKAESEEDLKKYFKFFTDFSKRKSIPTIVYEELLDYDVFLAYSKENELLGGCAFLLDNDSGTYRYKHGATLYKYNENDLLLWEAIKYAKVKNYKIFDFGGVKVTEDEESYYFRHFKYKKKFGGELVDFYTYIKFGGLLKLFLFPFKILLNVFFKGDFNRFVNVNRGKKQ
ncbi:MAG TPA: peptidoglycan bridge formation glycyltransferase FemA/FemB family protein [Spirochaetota bacterium]|nr:peptidoglycan bridge formation glycyltransferase FemA/FemB family protein [Spirochaetota bacterium]HOS32344.1 peptidoglycan bridge formation glycyltransferase FemA/FemB family protein [Spirochaetota bacterium]HOS54441.1 peptidoglycan bridge formation glycyltransferase FemA/FemB family protein [Spirochaetota bacterium]HQF76934.1 peptidoglycan bridge formation glycyltransferase FemA/FemB family protein [Spirochaetota bacterium]HQH30997.1 peptidoglycan bridge formation glycyltransferase FemA/Fe